MGSGLSLSAALELAWIRAQASAESQGARRQADAEQRLAGTWMAAPPTVEVLQREGRGHAAQGVRESEVGVSVPLWRPGQRGQNMVTAQAQADWAAASERAARFRLAMELLELDARLKLSTADVRQARAQAELLDAVRIDVERRVKAGDLAPADAMAARAEWLVAVAVERDAVQAESRQRSAWTLMTGSRELLSSPLNGATAGPLSARDVEDVIERHPDVQLADLAWVRARERVAQLQSQRAAAPELGIGLRQDRPGVGQAHQNSMAVSLRLPFGSEAHSGPRLAAALAEVDVAVIGQQRVRRQLAVDLALAQEEVAASSASVNSEGERAVLLRERARLLKKSFDAGETALPELLRTLAAASQAEASALRHQAVHAQAQARLQHALGQLP